MKMFFSITDAKSSFHFCRSPYLHLLLRALLILLVLQLSSCGFQLRGYSTFPEQLRVIYVKSSNPYGQFEHDLKKSLRDVGVTVIDTPQDAATLQIIQSNLTSVPSSVGTGPQATVYSVLYQVQLALYDVKGHTLIAPTTLRSRSTMIVNAQQALSATNQLDIMGRELERDLIIQTFNLLTSKAAHGVKKQTDETHN